MYVSATEFRTNVGKYLDLAESEDIIVVKHGVPHVTISSSKETKKKILNSLVGVGSSDLTEERILEERRKDYESLD